MYDLREFQFELVSFCLLFSPFVCGSGPITTRFSCTWTFKRLSCSCLAGVCLLSSYWDCCCCIPTLATEDLALFLGRSLATLFRPDLPMATLALPLFRPVFWLVGPLLLQATFCCCCIGYIFLPSLAIRYCNNGFGLWIFLTGSGSQFTFQRCSWFSWWMMSSMSPI